MNNFLPNKLRQRIFMFNAGKQKLGMQKISFGDVAPRVPDMC